MPSTLPTPSDDYAAPADMELSQATWDAALTSIGARLRALEAVQASWEALVAAGTGQALAAIAANVGPSMTAVTSSLAALRADVADAEDMVTELLAEAVPASRVTETADRLWCTPALVAQTARLDDRLLQSTALPFVMVAQGQSNSGGAADGGDQTVADGIKIWNGTAMIPAVFGVAPLNRIPTGGGGWSNNSAVHAANELRRLEIIPPSREIWIIPNWQNSTSIAEWVGAGSTSSMWVALTTALEAAAVETVDWVVFAQGEADNNNSTEGYDSDDLWLGAFRTLMGQWRSLRQWSPSTIVTAQELGNWRLNTQQDRTSAIRKLVTLDDPAVVRVATTGLPHRGDSLHFSGTALVTLGFRHARAFLSARIGQTAGADLMTIDGTAEARAHTITVADTDVGAPYEVDPDLLRSTLIILASNAEISLAPPKWWSGARLIVVVTSATGAGVTLTLGSGGIVGVPWQDTSGDLLLRQPRAYEFVSDGASLRYIGASWQERQVIHLTASRALSWSDLSRIITNAGASARLDLPLLPLNTSLYSDGRELTFIVQNSHGIRLTADAGDRIQFGGVTGNLGGWIESTTVGSSITLVSITSIYWAVISATGTWTMGG